jgi:sarcosine/dimethylglycine N-methyltransferase
MADIQEIQAYYEGSVEPIYRSVFGTNLHLAMFEGDESREVAQQQTKAFLTARLPPLSSETTIFDLGSGYGDMPRYLAQKFGCRVVGLNLVHIQNVMALSLSHKAGLGAKIFAVEADFTRVPFPTNCAEIVWSQEAMLHAPRRERVVREAARMLRPRGVFLFTDILQTGSMEAEEARLIQERVKIEPLDSFASYQRYIKEAGLELVEIADLSHYVARYYQDHAQQIKDNRETLVKVVDPAFVDYTVGAMGHWVKAAEEGKLGWGMFLCRKPEGMEG